MGFEDKKGKHTREKGSVIWGRRGRGGGEERERMEEEGLRNGEGWEGRERGRRGRKREGRGVNEYGHREHGFLPSLPLFCSPLLTFSNPASANGGSV